MNMGGQLTDDPFRIMAMQAHAAGIPSASVTVSASTASEDYSRNRVTVTVNAPCPPTEAHVSCTAEAAYILARRLVNQMADDIGIPRLGS
jgi:hypothetical protein